VRLSALEFCSTDQPTARDSASGDHRDDAGGQCETGIADRKGNGESQAPARAVACEPRRSRGHALLEQWRLDNRCRRGPAAGRRIVCGARHCRPPRTPVASLACARRATEGAMGLAASGDVAPTMEIENKPAWLGAIDPDPLALDGSGSGRFRTRRRAGSHRSGLTDSRTGASAQRCPYRARGARRAMRRKRSRKALCQLGMVGNRFKGRLLR